VIEPMTKAASTQTELIELLRRFFTDCADEYEIDMAFLYGSRAGGLPRIDSDLDVAVLFGRRDLSEEEAFARIADISLKLANLLRMEVNVLHIHDDFRKPMLYYNVIALGTPVYARQDAQLLSLRNDALFHMGDFGIFGLGWQYEVAKKNLESLIHAGV